MLQKQVEELELELELQMLDTIPRDDEANIKSKISSIKALEIKSPFNRDFRQHFTFKEDECPSIETMNQQFRSLMGTQKVSLGN